MMSTRDWAIVLIIICAFAVALALLTAIGPGDGNFIVEPQARFQAMPTPYCYTVAGVGRACDFYSFAGHPCIWAHNDAYSGGLSCDWSRTFYPTEAP